MYTTLQFFTQLFKKVFTIGSDAQKIEVNQMIDETFVSTLLEMHETQFVSRVKNLGYTITDDTPKSNIIFFVCYKTACSLILGQYTQLPQGSTLKSIEEMAKNYEALALQDVNLVVQQVPIAGFTVSMNSQNIRP